MSGIGTSIKGGPAEYNNSWKCKKRGSGGNKRSSSEFDGRRGPKNSRKRYLLIIPKGQKLVLQLELSMQEVPEGVTIVPGISALRYTDESFNVDERKIFEKAKVDLLSFMTRVFVKSIEAEQTTPGIYLVRLQCVMNHAANNLTPGSGYIYPYEHIWKRVSCCSWNKIISQTIEGTTTIDFKKSSRALNSSKLGILALAIKRD